jgi:hypothetical protein
MYKSPAIQHPLRQAVRFNARALLKKAKPAKTKPSTAVVIVTYMKTNNLEQPQAHQLSQRLQHLKAAHPCNVLLPQRRETNVKTGLPALAAGVMCINKHWRSISQIAIVEFQKYS